MHTLTDRAAALAVAALLTTCTGALAAALQLLGLAS